MSLLRRIESARPASEVMPVGASAAVEMPAVKDRPPQTSLPAVAKNGVTPPPSGSTPPSGNGVSTGRMLAQVPLRESFRDAKFRIQQRVIQELDPKLDLSNQVEVRREIEEAFGRAL